ncbi:LysR family transcriptional regulator [Mycobacterium sp. MFM001]|uniref:LysR family transcriptional regulator n=1 Tax=Mycobacterium sp. MFM001 TaxID=2049453 RepID=UPI000DA5886D|nr:LysR family transcriptional regulator [Mycobacterium sp. MFM001]GBE67979.1 LysR family transcriptional regulator [Mycobacterium sp. MFM001]
MELRQLRHFVAVAEERHFTRAAARAHVVQSTLSASINVLERELGTALLIRNSRRVDLTAAGRALLPAARTALAAADNARAAVAAVRGVLSGHLTIGVVQALGIIDLPLLLTRYHERYPGVSVSLRHNTVDGLVRATVDGDLDLAFVNRPYDDRRVDEVPLGTEFLVLGVRPDDPLARAKTVTLTDLAQREFIGGRADLAIRARVDATCSEVGLHRNICCESDTLSDLVELVGSGFGIAFLPPAILEHTDRVVGIKTEPAIPWELVVVTAVERPPSPAATAFLEMLPAAP